MILAWVAAAGARVPEASEQVRINGRVATFGSVVATMDGDTAAAALACAPLPFSAPYLTRERVAAERVYNAVRPPWACAILAAAALGATFVVRRRRCLLQAVVVGLFIVEAGAFGLQWQLGEALPLRSLADMLAAVALALSLVAALGRRLSLPALRLTLGCVALLGIAAAVMGQHPATRPVNPALLSPWLGIHVTLMVGAYGLLLFGAVGAIADASSQLLHRTIAIGWGLLGAGILVGSLWAADAWGSYWSWDPKETAALVTWLLYGALLAAWRQFDRHPRLRRLLTAATFASVLLTALAITSGLHSY